MSELLKVLLRTNAISKAQEVFSNCDISIENLFVQSVVMTHYNLNMADGLQLHFKPLVGAQCL